MARNRGKICVEPFAAETVAPPDRTALRGSGRSTPVWWEAFDDEGLQGIWIPQSSLPRPNWDDGAAQMPIMAAPQAQRLAAQGAARRIFASHSFPFFTDLCEKDLLGPASLVLLAGRHK
ncbi:hypothetical protein [Dongia deserti]|uniref:hypothetical protein n=1 Tax=Dongia deserti TaxID=2268030 RepID=UPI0013C4FD32|nr:hypothetical protein [Dongia deserti]